VEDVGLADPNAMSVALNAKEVYHFLGSPEGELAIAEAVVYLSAAPKSNRIYSAYKKVMRTVEEEPAYEVPYHIRNAVTGLMKGFGYGKGYKYAHDVDNAITGQSDLPDQLSTRVFYEPSEFGIEKKIKERLEYWAGLREQARVREREKKVPPEA
jgi:putative ATPase